MLRMTLTQVILIRGFYILLVPTEMYGDFLFFFHKRSKFGLSYKCIGLSSHFLPFAILIVIILVGSVLWYLKDIKKDVTTIKADVKTNRYFSSNNRVNLF